jgi:hypothetical protein
MTHGDSPAIAVATLVTAAVGTMPKILGLRFDVVLSSPDYA